MSALTTRPAWTQPSLASSSGRTLVPVRPGGAAQTFSRAAAVSATGRPATLRHTSLVAGTQQRDRVAFLILCALPPPRCVPAPPLRSPPPPRAGLRLVEPGEADSAVPYTSPEQAAAFAAALADPALCETVLAQVRAAGRGQDATRCEWVEGAAFVPSAWSPSTPRGVPPAWNELAGRGDHVVIQVPPPVTYAVRVPGRVCAIYRLVGE